MSLTLLERTANLREQAAATRRAIDNLKSAGVDWTTYYLLAGEIEEVAATGINTAYSALQRLEQLAKERLPDGH